MFFIWLSEVEWGSSKKKSLLCTRKRNVQCMMYQCFPVLCSAKWYTNNRKYFFKMLLLAETLIQLYFLLYLSCLVQGWTFSFNPIYGKMRDEIKNHLHDMIRNVYLIWKYYKSIQIDTKIIMTVLHSIQQVKYSTWWNVWSSS